MITIDDFIQLLAIGGGFLIGTSTFEALSGLTLPIFLSIGFSPQEQLFAGIFFIMISNALLKYTGQDL